MTLRRGDVIVVADNSGQFTAKPRPAVVVQANAFSDRATVTIGPITSKDVGASLFRVPIAPSPHLRWLAPRGWKWTYSRPFGETG